MAKYYPYDLWISVGSDAGISFATVGRLAKDSSMMQGILLSLQSLMTTEVDVADSQFMTGQNEYVRFGTFTMSGDQSNIIVQYIVKSDTANKINLEEENIVQELALAFCKFIMLTPNFTDNVEAGRTISPDNVTKSYLSACTIAKQKTPVKEYSEDLQQIITAELKNAEENCQEFPTLLQIKELEQWIGEEELTWEKGSITSFKRQLILQMLSQDVLNKIIREDPFTVLQYKNPRYLVEEIGTKIEDYLKKSLPSADKLIEKYIGKKLEKRVSKHISQLEIDELHAADTFISDYLTRETVTSLANDIPLLALGDFREIGLYRSVKKSISELTEIGHPGNFICDALIENVSPLVLQGTRLFLNQLVNSFSDRKLPPSVWNAITDFTFAVVSEEQLPKPKKGKKKVTSALEAKKKFIIERISKATIREKEWKKQIIEKFEKAGFREQLQISNIEESVLFAKALEKAIISTLEKIVEDQFLNSTLGDVFVYIIKRFQQIAPITVFSGIFEKIIADLKARNYEISEHLGLSTRDLLGAALEEGLVKAHVNSIPVNLVNPWFRPSRLKFDGRTISSTQLLLKPGLSFSIDNKIYPLREIEQNAELLTACLIDSKTLRRSYGNAMIRKMMSSYSEKIFKFEADILYKLDNLITIFQKEKVSTLKNANIIPEVKEAFPAFPDVGEIPNKFKDKDYHTQCQDIWNKYAPKVHKTIQELLSNFANVRSNDLNYKKKAMKNYDKAAKELKKIRKSLNKGWEKINAKVEKEVKSWAKNYSSDINPHVDKIRKNYDKWISEAFKIQKLETGKFTHSLDAAYKLINEKLPDVRPKDIEEIPKNFAEIALSILLYRRIPDYVIDDSYNQMIQDEKSAAISVRRAWSRSKTRKEFENNLYMNIRVLGNTLIKSINAYVRTIHGIYVKNDMELSGDQKGFYIDLGIIPKEIYSTKSEIKAIYKFENIDIVSSGKDWQIKLYIEPQYLEKMITYKDRLVVVSDVIRFVSRIKFDENTEPLIEGIKSTIHYLVQHGDKSVIDVTETMKEALFKLSDYPTILAEDV